jgi:hypothetical protein
MVEQAMEYLRVTIELKPSGRQAIKGFPIEFDQDF